MHAFSSLAALTTAALVVSLAGTSHADLAPPRSAPPKGDEAPKKDTDAPKTDEAKGDSIMRAVKRGPDGRLIVEELGLRDPKEATAKAPGAYKVRFMTTRGPFTVQVTRYWAPNGADRFYNLVKVGYFKDIAFFRVLKNFMAQAGIHGDPEISAVWRTASIPDDPVKKSNLRGFVTFATAGPNTRTTQFFINYGNNSRLDKDGFAPFGEVISGMEILDGLYVDYGEGAPSGKGPDQGQVQAKGNAYLQANFGNLDYIVDAEILED